MENAFIDTFTDLMLIGCILLAVGLSIFFGYRQYNSNTEKLRRRAIRKRSANKKLSINKKKDNSPVA